MVTTTVSNAKFGQVLAADGVILGSSVENANTHPDIQKWINDSWDVTQDLSNKVGAAFVTAGGLSAREARDHEQSDSDNDDIPNDNCWGKFMVMSIWCIGDNL